MTNLEYDNLPLPNKQVYDLCIKYCNGNVSAFANMIGVSKQVLNRIFKIDPRSGKHPSVSQSIKKSISIALGYDETWFIDSKTRNVDIVVSSSQSRAGIPYFGESEMAAAGTFKGFGNGLFAKEASEMIKLPSLQWRDGDFAIPVRGRSMIDKEHPDQCINDGAIVCLRPWRERFIRWGEIYCFATHDGFVVKRPMPSPKGDEYMLLVSSNEEEGYMPFEVERSAVIDIAIVTAIINLQVL